MEAFQHLPADDDRAKLASQVIEGLRAKLLDLTTRNPLLNYRHSDRAKAQVRVIDEIPDALHGFLTDGRSLVFRALQEPDDQPEDEKSDEFQIALEAERLEDEEYVEGIKRLVGDDPNNPALLTLERALRDRVRAKLGLLPRPKRGVISLADVARSQGLDPSYELPTPGVEDREAHHAGEIQTLSLPDRMEAKLAALREGARRALEETGINTCFAAYGFVEWYESAASEKPLYAPLLLQPLEIERMSQQGRWRYFVKWTGEDTAINVTLAERMKQDFGLDWPALEEDESPESYFARLTDMIQTQQRWRVRRFVTFGLFAFGRLAMWSDLDPSRWPTNRQPPTHPIVASLMAGGGSGEGTVASEYEVDSPEIASRLPPLVLDADSSQMAVVLDALAGKSLAVKGPPGTGKSQTIANLIAAALVQGKSVLFVAEKMAALEVVKSRLDRAGLGHFVLELHSTKSKKKDVLESLARRLETQGRLTPPARIEQELSELARLRSQLNAYVALMKQPFGATGKTVQEILWAAQRTSTAELPASIDRVVIPAAESMTLGDVERVQDLLGQFQSVLADLSGRWGAPGQHPWAWLNRILSPFERDDLLELVREWRGQIGALRDLAEDCRGLVETSVNSREELRSLWAVLAKLPGTGSGEVNRQVLVRLAIPADRDDLNRLERAISKRQTLHERCSAFGPTEALLGRKDRIAELAQLVKRLDVGDQSSDQMEQVLGQLEESREALSAVVEAIEGLASLFEAGPSRNAATLEILLAAAQLVGATPRSALLHRRREVDSPEAKSILERAAQEGELLRDTRRQLRLAFDMDRAARVDDLRAVAQVLRHAGIFGRLGARYRRSRETWRGLVRQPRKATGQAMAADLERIADQLEREREFARDPDLARMLGAQFAGIETDLRPVLSAATFLAATREMGASSIPTRADLREKSRVRDVLAEGHIGILERIAAFGSGGRRKLVQQGLDALVQHSSNEMPDVVHKLDEKRSTGQRLVVVLRELQIRSGLGFVSGVQVTWRSSCPTWPRSSRSWRSCPRLLRPFGGPVWM